MIRRSLASWVGRWAIPGLLGGALIAACSASGRGTNFDDDEDSSGNSSKSGGGGLFDNTTGGGGLIAGSGGGTACASDQIKAELTPLDMVVMLDQSTSMDGTTGAGSKWDAVTGALQSFVTQPGLDGIAMSLSYFGVTSGGGSCPAMCQTTADCGACGPCVMPIPGFFGFCQGASAGDSCNAADYAKPEVPVTPFPAASQLIINSMAMHSPSTGTPTHPALSGAIQYAKDWYGQNLSHAVIVVFATDGEPSGCDEDLNHINAVAADGLTAGILTFVIGVGDLKSALDGIAVAGGTNQAFLVDTNANANQEFLDAMNEIRGSVLACSYKIPVPTTGIPDFNSVNVQYTPGDGSKPQIFPKVQDIQSCPPNGDAWYYDNNKTPTQIVMCNSTCDKIKQDVKGQVDILLGCETIVN